MALLAAYWQKERLEVYRYVDNKPVRQAAGPWNTLKPFQGTFDQKILVIARENLFQVRKRYPPASAENLAKAIELEAKEIFPLTDPAFYFLIRESFSTHTLVDLWGWDKGEAECLRAVFPYTYLIPEDLAFKSASPEVRIFSSGGMVHLLAHSDKQFLAALSYPEKGLEEEDVERFLRALGPEAPSIRKIRIYGPLLKGLTGGELPEIWRGPDPEFPLCLETIPNLILNDFKVKKGLQLPFGLESLFRLANLLLLGIGLMLFLTMNNYDQGIREIKQKIGALDQKKSPTIPSPQPEDYSGMVWEINEKLKASPSPLTIMDLLARRLPKGTFLNRLVINENTLELALSSKVPLAVVKDLGNIEGFKSVKIKGPPIKDGASGAFQFALTVELKK